MRKYTDESCGDVEVKEEWKQKPGAVWECGPFTGPNVGTSNFSKVIDFHHKFGITVRSKPNLDSPQDTLLRLRLIAEEYAELIKALNFRDITGVADALGDLLYVVYGAAATLGIPIDEVFEIIHNANMKKQKGTDRGGKVIKPPGFEGPEGEIAKLLGDISGRESNSIS